MKVEQRMARNSNEDKIELGLIAERIAIGDPGTYLRAVIEGIKSDYIQKADAQNAMPADRALGVITGLTVLQNRLDIAVSDKNKLQEEVKDNSEVKSGDSKEEENPQDNPLK